MNTFVYDLIAEREMKQPDIPVCAAEHYGQCGEDLIVAGLLLAIASREGTGLAGQQYLEIGANHPVSCSATYLLHRRYGMHGVLVEANPRLLDDLRRFRPNDEIVHAAVVPEPAETVEFHVSNQDELSSVDRRFVEEWRGGVIGISHTLVVPAATIGDLLARHFSHRAPLFLAIDIEGLDLAILQTVDWGRWRPAVVQAEPSEHHAPGNTAATVSFLESVGYTVLSRTDVNLIAIDTGRIPLVGSPGESAAPPHPTIFQSLDDLRRIAEDREAAIVQLNEALRRLEQKTEADTSTLQALLEEFRADRESLMSTVASQQALLEQTRIDRESLETAVDAQRSLLEKAERDRETLEADISDRRAMLEKAKSEADGLRGQTERLRRHETALQTRVESLRGKLAAAAKSAKKERDQANREIKATQKSAKAAIGSANRRAAKLEAELAKVRQKLVTQRAAIESMKSSWAWRATVPFRFIARAVTRIRRKRGAH